MWLVALLAPGARSSRPPSVTGQPARAARRAIASPVTPPPSTSRSRSSSLTRVGSRVRGSPRHAFPDRLGRIRAGGSGQLRPGMIELVELPVGLEKDRRPFELPRLDLASDRGGAVFQDERDEPRELRAAEVGALVEESVARAELTRGRVGPEVRGRSEEHTSELQSRLHL